MSTLKRTNTTRVPRRTLSAVIASRLRQHIEDGTYPPGTQLSEVELATKFSTSRGPLREAIQRLAQEGLLVSEPHRGVFVPQLNDDDLDDLYFARAALERAAMLRLVERGLPAAAQAALEQVVGEMEQAIAEEDWNSVPRADLRFHEIVVAAADSPRLTHMYETLASQTRLGLNLLVSTYKGRTDLLQEHTRLLALLTAGDRQGLEVELGHHFGEALATLHQHQPRPRSRKNRKAAGDGS